MVDKRLVVRLPLAIARRSSSSAAPRTRWWGPVEVVQTRRDPKRRHGGKLALGAAAGAGAVSPPRDSVSAERAALGTEPAPAANDVILVHPAAGGAIPSA